MRNSDGLFDIPAGTPPAACRGCGAEVWWIRTTPKPPKLSRRMLVSVKCPGGRAPTATVSGLGISHFADCPTADRFRRRGAAERRSA